MGLQKLYHNVSNTLVGKVSWQFLLWQQTSHFGNRPKLQAQIRHFLGEGCLKLGKVWLINWKGEWKWIRKTKLFLDIVLKPGIDQPLHDQGYCWWHIEIVILFKIKVKSPDFEKKFFISCTINWHIDIFY